MSEATLERVGEGRFELTGPLTFTSVPALWARSRARLDALEVDDVELDLGGVERVDSAGLALLVAWSRWARDHSRSLRFSHGPSQLKALVKGNNLQSLLALEAV